MKKLLFVLFLSSTALQAVDVNVLKKICAVSGAVSALGLLNVVLANNKLERLKDKTDLLKARENNLNRDIADEKFLQYKMKLAGVGRTLAKMVNTLELQFASSILAEVNNEPLNQNLIYKKEELSKLKDSNNNAQASAETQRIRGTYSFLLGLAGAVGSGYLWYKN